MIINFKRTYSPMGLIYEDEIDELKKLINIVDIEYVDSSLIEQKEIKMYKITLLRKDAELMERIMRDYPGNSYALRKR